MRTRDDKIQTRLNAAGGTMTKNRTQLNDAAREHGPRVQAGIIRLFGFGLSIVVLALTSLAVIPAMVAADGEVAWGAIVVGQAVGAVAAVVVAYGWGVFGPARIASTSPTVRRAEYVESIRTGLVLLVPISAIAAVVACLLAPGQHQLAAAGAIAATSVGLTPQWYFVGMSRPFAMLLLDTIPRAGGTIVGIVLMHLGHGALTGLIGMFLGVLAGWSITTTWVLWTTRREGAEPIPRRPLRTVFLDHRHGIASTLGISTYFAAPLMIVSVTAPGIQPVFALADKLQKQVTVALAPASTVLQGWVPRAVGVARSRRIKTALIAGCGFALVIGVGAVIVLPFLTDWLGNGQISLSFDAIVLIAACIAVTFIERVVEVAALAPFERLDVVTRAVTISAIVGLPLVALGATFGGTTGALGGVLAGLVICVVIECVECVRCMRSSVRSAAAVAPISTGGSERLAAPTP
jgi:hypothetical protein